MTKFADQLLDDLIREHGSTLAATRPPASPRRRITARRTLLAAGGGGAVAAIAATLVAGGGTPAYAITKNPDGTITLAVYRAAGIAEANARLRQLEDGQVVVVPVEPGCPSLGSLPAPAVKPAGVISVQGSSSVNGSVTVNAQGIPAGDIIVVATQAAGQDRMTASRLTSPPAPTCVSLPAPPDGGPGTTVSGNG